MPGRIMMEQSRVPGSHDLKKDRSNAQEGVQLVQQVPAPDEHLPSAAGSSIGAPNGTFPNGVSVSNGVTSNANEISSDAKMALEELRYPPTLDQSWRQTTSYKSLGLMMERVAQQCYFDLNSTLTAMSEASDQQQQPAPPTQQPNGILSHDTQDLSESSLKMKRLLLEFANGQRDRFIKTLVLSDCSRNEDDMAKLIDIKVWQDKQRLAQANAARAIGQTKINMIAAKMPNPNIEGAMELLGSGKASWVPDLGYLPPKRLSAKQLLRTLRDMNVTLATRLNLHEELPAHMREFSIANGRATFTVKQEFEVDLSVADEDPATPFYFIDIRLLFTPTPSALNDGLRNYMEGKANQELAARGLKGCYDFLHNFVLTHKINVLRSQAGELLRGKWFDCLRVENMRRTLIVQYWVGMPGPKSWIEIGIGSGKQGGDRSRRTPTPQLVVRWFRRGAEVKDEPLDFDWQDLSCEKCLSNVIAKHSSWILGDIQTRLRTLASGSSSLTVEITEPALMVDVCTLSLCLPSMRVPLTVRIEPVTGSFSISPASRPTAHMESRLNKDPTVDAPRSLAGLLCLAVQDRVRKEAELSGWESAALSRQDNLQAVFGEPVLYLAVFIPSRAWGRAWALAATSSLNGDKWWFVQLEEKHDDAGGLVGRIITFARQITVQGATEKQTEPSQAALARIERTAVAEVAFSALCQQLKELRIPHTLQRMSPATGGDPSPAVAIFIRFAPLLQTTVMQGSESWAADAVRLTHHGIADDGMPADDDLGLGLVRHDLRLTLEPGRMKHLRKHLSRTRERDLAVNSTGGLALRLLTPFGQPFVEQIRTRLRSIERLDHYAATLKDRKFKCSHLSLSRLTFSYHAAPELSAQLTFSNDGNMPIRLKLEPPASNPHQRVRVMLEHKLNSAGDNSFRIFTVVLAMSLPLLQVLERLEATDPADRTLSIHPRSSTWFSLKYKTPLPTLMFHVRIKSSIQGSSRLLRWHIQDARSPSMPAPTHIPPELVGALKGLYQDKTEHWFGLGNCLVADTRGIGPVLERLDEIMRRFGKSNNTVVKEKEDTAFQPLQPGMAVPKNQRPDVKQPLGAKSAAAALNTMQKGDPDIVILD